jgi:hypothetical protein
MSNQLVAEAATYTTHKMKSHALSRFELAIPAIKRLQTCTLDCVAGIIYTVQIPVL